MKTSNVVNLIPRKRSEAMVSPSVAVVAGGPVSMGLDPSAQGTLSAAYVSRAPMATKAFVMTDMPDVGLRRQRVTSIAQATGSDASVLVARTAKTPRQTERSIQGAPGLVEITYRKGRRVWVYRFTDPHTRKRASIVLGSSKDIDEIDARILARTYADRIKCGVSPVIGLLTVQTYFETVRMPAVKKRLKSWRDVEGVFNRYVRGAIGHLRLGDVTLQVLRDLVASLQSGATPTQRRTQLADATINQVIASLKGLFGAAHKAGEIPTNPAAALQMLKLHNERKVVYSDDELRVIFAGVREVNPLVRLFFVMLLGTGARTGELLGARYADLDEQACTLYVRDNKAGRPFLMPLSPDVMAAVVELKTLARSGNPYLFPAIRGDGPMASPRKAFKKVLDGAGITNRTFHDARKTAISCAVQAPGVTLVDASRMANHADTRITEKRYVVTGDARIRHAMTEVGKRLQLCMGLNAQPINDPEASVNKRA